MSYEKYCGLIDQLCEKLGIEDSKSMYELCSFRFEENGFSIGHTQDDEGNLTLFCDYGDIPNNAAARVMRRLLESNMYMIDSKSPHFAINEETGRVLLITPISMDKLTVDDLLDVISVHGINAKLWRDTYFLEELIDEKAREFAEPTTAPNAEVAVS